MKFDRVEDPRLFDLFRDKEEVGTFSHEALKNIAKDIGEEIQKIKEPDQKVVYLINVLDAKNLREFIEDFVPTEVMGAEKSLRTPVAKGITSVGQSHMEKMSTQEMIAERVAETIPFQSLKKKTKEFNLDPDVNYGMRRIRRAIIEELKNYLSKDEFYVISESILGFEKDTTPDVKKGKRPSGVHIHRDRPKKKNIAIVSEPSSETDVVVKDVRAFFTSGRSLERELRHFVGVIDEARKKNDERANYFTPVKRYGEGGKQLVVEKREMGTLADVIEGIPKQQKEDEEKDLEEVTREQRIEHIQHALRVLLHACFASQLAHEHSFIIRDMKPANIGVDKKTGDGFLFDYDGLALEGFSESSVYTPGYRPPEIRDPAHITDVSESVYQYGMCLEDILERASQTNPLEKTVGIYIDIDELLEDLSEDMTKKMPGDRLSLDESINRLEYIIEDIGIFLEDEWTRHKFAA